MLTAELGEQQEREAPESNAGTDLVGAETLSNGEDTALSESIQGSGKSENASQSQGSDAGNAQTVMPSEKDPEPVPAQQSLSASERVIAAGAALNSGFPGTQNCGSRRAWRGQQGGRQHRQKDARPCR